MNKSLKNFFGRKANLMRVDKRQQDVTLDAFYHFYIVVTVCESLLLN